MKRALWLAILIGCATSNRPPSDPEPPAADDAQRSLLLGSKHLQEGRAAEALVLFEKSCRLGEEAGCELAEDLKTYLRIYQESLEHCAPNDAAACEELCARGSPESCAELARILEGGDAEMQDVLRAVSSYELACGRGVKESCVAVGKRYLEGDGVAADARKAGKWFELGCALGDEASCELAREWSDR